MEELELYKRSKNTVHEARKERKLGKVPGIIYGKNINNLMFEIGELELNKKISNNGEHGILNVRFQEEKYNTLIKEVQRDSVNHRIVHIDLEEIPKNETIQTDVPIIFTGEELIMRKGGVVQKEKTNIKVQCKSENIPNHINIDISNLEIGQSYRVGDIELSKDIAFIDDLNTIIAFVTANNKVDDNGLEGVVVD
ncbi:50S ribosomal protein L25 [Clostridium sp. P21]|uniref:Large ribosomal subunit protein bL25 n=1 Tax=Clostridium muellerianum TaxID=2716538 RepID=A0A7Y0ECT7_9CLOT|nr:50S ribosomal protein L25 [Clostridium muellerianum]NMM61119.1 50S ribosomal protein L25 [Clostridium muellerianum]